MSYESDFDSFTHEQRGRSYHVLIKSRNKSSGQVFFTRKKTLDKIPMIFCLFSAFLKKTSRVKKPCLRVIWRRLYCNCIIAVYFVPRNICTD